MLKAAWESVIRVVCHRTTALGAAATFLGILQQTAVIPATIPAWVWWGVAIALIFATAVRLDMELLAEQRRRPPEPNMSLEDVMVRITRRSSTSQKDGKAGADILAAFDKIRELALQGRLAVFGRYNVVASDMDRFPREPIPADFWRGHQIGYLEYLRDRRGKTERCRADAKELPYSDLYFDRVQVDARWSAASR
jgi:hypothetical protein